jgi:1-acyl-sn-glycerol-3-phosphate acyltransferase
VTELLDTVRGISLLGRLFGTAPIVAFRVSRPRMDRAAARAEVLRHTTSARRYASVDLDVAPLPDRRSIGSSFVLVYNQTSIADDLGNLEVLWQVADRSVLAAEYGRIPFFGAAARNLGIVLMRRGDRTSTEKTLADLAGWAAAGQVVSIGAEGRLSPDGEVAHFKRGAFLVAIRAGVPVVPMAVHGGRQILRPGSLRLRPGTLRYRVGSPIPIEGLTEADAPALAESTRRIVASLSAEAARDSGTAG